MEVDDLPYRAEYAKSSRASCRGCKVQISKETLRMAVMIQSPMFDGKMAHWYHMSCFFGKQRPKTVGDIAHFESLRYEDQEKIKEKINTLGAAVVPAKKGKKRGGAASKGASTSGDSKAALKDFNIEYAKSGRAACRGCEQKILKDEVRISKKDFESDVGKRYGGQDKWHHVECFAKLRSELQYYECGDMLPGFKSLKVEDQKKIKTQLPAIKQEDVPEIKKPKLEDEVDNKANDKLEKEIKKQNQTIFKHRDALKAGLKRKQLQEILEHNEQYLPSGEDKLLDILSDVMTFGALEKCPNCKEGDFVFSKVGYICQGNLSEWAKCQNTIQEPKRKPFEIPEEYKKFTCFKGYKCVLGTRKIQFTPSTTDVKKEKEEEYTGPKVEREKPALYEMKFFLIGLKLKEKSACKAEIIRLGGKVQKNFSDGPLMAVISNKTQMENQDKHHYIISAKTQDIHVVSIDFVNEAKDYVGRIPELIKKTSICTWGSDPNTRMPAEPDKSLKSKSIFTKSVPKSVTMRIKGGGAVDPDSHLENVAHVYQQGKDKWNAVLSLTDLQKQKNSFYKLQILECDTSAQYWLFRSWGRIATTIGGNKLEKVNSINEAKSMFKALYEEKTGNKWGNRENFVKVPGRMFPVDIDEVEEEESMEIEESETPSKLEKQVQDLIRLIFDVNIMKQTMLEFELDLEKMPLGKLSKKQIQSALGVLNELEKLIDSPDDPSLQHKFIDCSNRFYTFIPHSFGVDNPPLINTNEMIKEKITMLDSLMELEIAYNLMKNTRGKDGNTTVDGYYDQLKTEMEVLDKDSEEFKLIKDYVKNTHAATHSHYGLEVEEVFSVKRQGEDKRYRPFKKLHNRKLLWHGSRLTNFAGILSQGLRIAPPEAPATGYMFGKGIYFADMVSKSANYCCTSSYNPTGLMLLCEVALGNEYERQKGDYIEQLPDGKHSCKGLGMTHPDPKKSVIKNGVEIPLGKGVTNKVQSSLLYNEYIVYDIAQVNVKYLLKMDFKYNY